MATSRRAAALNRCSMLGHGALLVAQKRGHEEGNGRKEKEPVGLGFSGGLRIKEFRLQRKSRLFPAKRSPHWRKTLDLAAFQCPMF